MIIISIIVGPFSQQVVQYGDCQLPVDFSASPASLPRTNIFIGAGNHTGAGLVSITQSEQAAIIAGITAPGGQVSASCPTGNCTFPDYTTVGYCSSVVDVSSTVETTKLNNMIHSGNQTSYYPTWRSSLPSGVVMLYNNISYHPNLSTIGLSGYGDFQFLIGLPGSPYDAATGNAPTGCDTDAARGSWRCKGYGAANFTLYPCIKRFHASITNGLLNETLIAHTNQTGPWGTGEARLPTGQPGIATINASCLNSDQINFVRRLGYTTPTTGWIPYNISGSSFGGRKYVQGISLSEVLAFEQSAESDGCLFAMHLEFDMSLQQMMYSTFVGNLSGLIPNDGAKETIAFTGPQILQTLYNFGDFSLERTESVLDNITTSLTNHIRQNPGFQNVTGLIAPVLGTQYTNKTCLRVEWKWLSLPYILVILTLIYSAGALMSLGNLSHGMRTWRNSPLPMMFHGPSGDVIRAQTRNHDGLQDIADMERVAKGIRLRLVPDANGSMEMVAQDHTKSAT